MQHKVMLESIQGEFAMIAHYLFIVETMEQLGYD